MHACASACDMHKKYVYREGEQGRGTLRVASCSDKGRGVQ